MCSLSPVRQARSSHRLTTACQTSHIIVNQGRPRGCCCCVCCCCCCLCCCCCCCLLLLLLILFASVAAACCCLLLLLLLLLLVSLQPHAIAGQSPCPPPPPQSLPPRTAFPRSTLRHLSAHTSCFQILLAAATLTAPRRTQQPSR